MLNQCVIVGRVKDFFQNELTIQADEERIVVELTGTILQNALDYLKVEDLVGIKGKILNGNKIHAEKITFLSSNRGGEDYV